jgi:hypothetical protein
MTEGFATFLLMNNYFHDVATAMFLSCAAALALVRRAAGTPACPAAGAYAAAIRKSIKRLAWFSAAWIVVSGVVRFATLDAFEWKNFSDKGLEAGLIAKYVIAALMLCLGGAWMAWESFRSPGGR